MSRVATFQCSLDNFFNVEAFSDGLVMQANARSDSLREMEKVEQEPSFTRQETDTSHSPLQLRLLPPFPSKTRQGRSTPLRLRPIMPATLDGRRETTVRIMLAAAEQASRAQAARSYLFTQPQKNMRLSEILMDLLPTEEAGREPSPTVSYLAGLRLEKEPDESKGREQSGATTLDQRDRLAYYPSGSWDDEGRSMDNLELPPSLARDIREASFQATRHRQAIIALRSRVEQNLQMRMEQGDQVAGEIFRQAREQDMLVRAIPERVSPRDRHGPGSVPSGTPTTGSAKKTLRVRGGRRREDLRPMMYHQLLPKPATISGGGEEKWEDTLMHGKGCELSLEAYFTDHVREYEDAFSTTISSPSKVSKIDSLIMYHDSSVSLKKVRKLREEFPL